MVTNVFRLWAGMTQLRPMEDGHYALASTFTVAAATYVVAQKFLTPWLQHKGCSHHHCSFSSMLNGEACTSEHH